MAYSGTIVFPNTLTESGWNELIKKFDLKQTKATTMTNPATGNSVTIQDPPNLLALVLGKDGKQIGIVRCSRLFFDRGISPEAEISFEGEGEGFESTVREICTYLDGSIQEC